MSGILFPCGDRFYFQRNALCIKSEQKVFYLYGGLFLLAALLAACGRVLDPEQAAAALRGRGNEELVRVLLPKNDARATLADDQVPVYTDYFEAVFRAHNTPTLYYVGKAELGSSYIEVRLPADKYYDVLFLAGRKSNKTLLATGFLNKAEANGHVSGGPGVPVVKDKVNVITMALTMEIVW
jgi:hypothetical protein